VLRLNDDIARVLGRSPDVREGFVLGCEDFSQWDRFQQNFGWVSRLTGEQCKHADFSRLSLRAEYWYGVNIVRSDVIVVRKSQYWLLSQFSRQEKTGSWVGEYRTSYMPKEVAFRMTSRTVPSGQTSMYAVTLHCMRFL
jgi:hypothetical protein